MARSSLAWVDLLSSPISSRKTVPRPAATNSPAWSRSAPVKRAADVAEELVLQQVVGDRRAVDGEEHGVGVGAEGVQGPGHQLLARARFPGDQHRAPGRADLADQRLHGLHHRAAADQRVEVLVGVELPPQGLVLEQQPAILHEPVDLGQQLLEHHRLHQIIMGPALECGHRVLDRGVGRDHDEERLGPDLERAVQKRQAVAAGKLDVAEHHVGLERGDQAQRRGHVHGRGHVVRLALEELLERGRDDFFIIDDEDAAARVAESPASGVAVCRQGGQAHRAASVP